MNNFYITEYFDWSVKRISLFDRVLNRILASFGLNRKVYTAEAIDKFVHSLLKASRRFPPVASGVLTNVEQRINIFHLVSQVLAYDVEGDIVELGCHDGKSSVLIQKLITEHKKPKILHLYDSFEGLPSLGDGDGASYREGQLSATEDAVRHNFKKYGLPLPEIHKGWFSDTLPTSLPDKICFAYLDGDLYESILISLQYVYPKLSKGAICLVDDYSDPGINPRAWNKLPGVKKACDEFLADKPEEMDFIYSGDYPHGYFRKQ